jgi:DNA (cytosine-5)-methyltransferase 1
MTHLDLFSGIGGFAIAAQACGYTTIGFCEREPYAQQILKERFGAVLADAESEREHREHREHRDTGGTGSSRHKSKPQPTSGAPRLHDNIFTLNGADYRGVDLLTGGFPCQPFSVAGKRKGKADDRALWPQMLRVIDGARPTWIIGENVAGIVSLELDNILSDLESLGYSAWPLVIPACAVDARHRRDRVWIVAHAIGLRESQSSGSFADERGRAGNQGEDVAYADEPSGKGDERTERSQQERAEHKQHCGRQSQPSIRRMADGLPEGLDSGGGFCQWPEENHETPRVTTGIKHRAHRLKGLGNSIVPQVAEEIIRAITSLR